MHRKTTKNMIGLTTLNNELHRHFDTLSTKEQLEILDAKKYLESVRICNDDWLLPFLYQNDVRQPLTISDAVAYCKLCDMIENKQIFLKMIPIENFAFANQCIDENNEILSKTRLFNTHLKNDSQGSDGTIQLKQDVIFRELGINDEICEKKGLKTIIVPKNTVFSIEIGTMPLVKFLAYLLAGHNLARLPYQVKAIKNMPNLALFTMVA